MAIQIIIDDNFITVWEKDEIAEISSDTRPALPENAESMVALSGGDLGFANYASFDAAIASSTGLLNFIKEEKDESFFEQIPELEKKILILERAKNGEGKRSKIDPFTKAAKK